MKIAGGDFHGYPFLWRLCGGGKRLDGMIQGVQGWCGATCFCCRGQSRAGGQGPVLGVDRGKRTVLLADIALKCKTMKVFSLLGPETTKMWSYVMMRLYGAVTAI